MTDKEFVEYITKMTDADKLAWLKRKLSSCVTRSKQEYSLNGPNDLDAMIEQEEYERLTGRH